jgi:NDP-sugar pyrophosphorylase family protein
VELDDDDRVRRIVGRPAGSVAGTLRGFMFPGLHVLEPSVFRWMHAEGAFSIMRETYPRLIAGGLAVYGFATSARWVNIDTPAALEAADLTLRTRPLRFRSGTPA